jgi:hypothetical protein
MKYLCLIYGEEGILEAMSKGDMDALINDSLDYDDVLRDSGHYLVSQALQSVRSAATLRVRNGKLSVIDGPFAETKEQLLGFILIDAVDLNDAVQAAAKIPMAGIGSVEVRPVRELARQ